MLSVEKRHDFILEELLRNGRVTTVELSRQLQVNRNTIQSDFEKLERRKLLHRVRGGAMPMERPRYSIHTHGLTFQENMQKQIEEKARIALVAIRFIKPGDTIALSPGSTTTHLARNIRQLQIPNLTVVTNAVNIAMELTGLPGLSLTLTGGLLLSDFLALVGPLAEQSLNQMYVAKAFVGVTGLDAEHGLTSPNQFESLTHRIMLQRAQRTIVLADHTKLGQVTLHYIAPITAIHTLITDHDAAPEVLPTLRALGIEVLTVY